MTLAGLVVVITFVVLIALLFATHDGERVTWRGFAEGLLLVLVSAVIVAGLVALFMWMNTVELW